jgi:chromosome segregation ATPase
MVGKANIEASQITQLWEQATRQKSEFDNLISQASESIKNIKAQLEAQKDEYVTLKSSLKNSEDELLSTAQTANDTLKMVFDSKDQIPDRLKE